MRPGDAPDEEEKHWYFSAKLHVGVDEGSGYTQTTIVAAANIVDIAVAANLILEDEQVLYGDSAYCAVGKHENEQADLHLSQVDYRTNKQKPYRKYAWDEGPGTHWLRKFGYQKCRVRSSACTNASKRVR